SRSPGFRPGVAVLSALLAAGLVAGGAFLASHLSDRGDGVLTAPTSPTTSLTTPATGSPSPTPTVTTDKPTSAPPASKPPVQGSVICSSQSTVELPPGDLDAQLAFSAVDGRVLWHAFWDGPGRLSTDFGSLAAGGTATVTLTLSATERAKTGRTTVTVQQDGRTVCRRVIAWQGEPTTPPSSEPPSEPPTTGEPPAAAA
ncbi:hypothetical protein, partial [Actinocorallia lasiicapitis]